MGKLQNSLQGGKRQGGGSFTVLERSERKREPKKNNACIRTKSYQLPSSFLDSVCPPDHQTCAHLPTDHAPEPGSQAMRLAQTLCTTTNPQQQLLYLACFATGRGFEYSGTCAKLNGSSFGCTSLRARFRRRGICGSLLKGLALLPLLTSTAV